MNINKTKNIMALHSPCSYAEECPWGSNTVLGTCGFSQCMRDRYKREAKHEYYPVANKILREHGELPEHGSMDTDYGKTYW